MKKDVSVELMRIIGCLMVIGVHMCLGKYVNGAVDPGRLYIACLLADGVAVFWMISGFFMFGNSGYKKLWKRTAKNIILPMVLISIVVLYFGRWILSDDGTTLAQSVSYTSEEYWNMFLSLLRLTNPVKYLGHFWYLYVYLLVMLIQPLLRAAVNYIDECAEHTKWFLVISFIFLVINDYTGNRLASFSHYSINGAVPAAILMIWGHIIYKNREKFRNNYVTVASVVAFLLLNFIRMKIQIQRYETGDTNEYILYWFSSIGLLCAICVILFCFSIIRVNKQSVKNRSIAYIGSLTMMIYMLHPLLKSYMNNHGITLMIQQKILGNHTDVVHEAVYTVCITLTVFLVTFIIAFVLKITGENLKKLFIRKSKGNEIHGEDVEIVSKK